MSRTKESGPSQIESSFVSNLKPYLSATRHRICSFACGGAIGKSVQESNGPSRNSTPFDAVSHIEIRFSFGTSSAISSSLRPYTDASRPIRYKRSCGGVANASFMRVSDKHRIIAFHTSVSQWSAAANDVRETLVGAVSEEMRFILIRALGSASERRI